MPWDNKPLAWCLARLREEVCKTVMFFDGTMLGLLEAVEGIQPPLMMQSALPKPLPTIATTFLFTAHLQQLRRQTSSGFLR
jgi:hypothetical protein